MTEFLFSQTKGAAWTFVLAHGAGAPMDSSFLDAFAAGLTAAGASVDGINVVRFEFNYMHTRREDGRRRPPSRAPALLDEFRQVIADLRQRWPQRRIVVGGKSMGGRMASMVADELAVDGLVCLGYPFHPAGKPERLRVSHLEALATPSLFCQGSRDALGNEEEVASYPLAQHIEFCWLADGDHSFKPRKASGHTLEGHYQTAQDRIIEFLKRL